MASINQSEGKYFAERNDNSYHFITLCTRKHTPYFGVILEDHIELSLIGKIAEFELNKLVKNRNVEAEDWVIMPNHIHLISNRFTGSGENMIYQFKSNVKNWTRMCGYGFQWQFSFHGHLIKNERELNNAKWYIRKNPQLWESDTLNQENQLNLSGHLRRIAGVWRYRDIEYEIQ